MNASHRARLFLGRHAAIALIVWTVVTRLPALLHPKAIDDEAVYAVVANEIVDGGRPYVDAIERKPPLLFWTYAAVFKVAGKYNWRALHLLAVAWTLATMAGLFRLGNVLWNRATGMAAALLYSVFGCYATWKNLAFNGEMMMNLPLVWAWAIGLGNSSSRLRLELLAAGALLATAFLLKQPAAIAAVPLGIYLLLPSYRTSRGLAFADAVTQFALLSIGFAGTVGAIAAVLAYEGILREAFYWTVLDHSAPHVFWVRALASTSVFIATCAPLLVGALISRRAPSGSPAEGMAQRTALFGWLVASVIGAVAGGRFYPHYYLQLIPPLALLASPAFAVRPRSPRATLSVWLGLTAAAFFLSHTVGLATRREESEAGRYLQSQSPTDARIFVWGQSPDIYLDARRRPATRYVATFPLTGYVFGGPIPGLDTRDRILPGAWDNWSSDVAAHPPAYVIDTQSDPASLYPVRDFPRLAELLARNYLEVARTSEGLIYRMK